MRASSISGRFAAVVRSASLSIVLILELLTASNTDTLAVVVSSMSEDCRCFHLLSVSALAVSVVDTSPT